MTLEGTQEESRVAFYEIPDCKGKSLTDHGPDDKLSLKGTDMEDIIPFMIWESDMDPTRGLEDMCTGDM
jgi:hypothetical protein